MTENTMIINNQVHIIGTVECNLEFSHEIYGEKFYTTKIAVERTSGTVDSIPVMVSERLTGGYSDYLGEIVEIKGQYRSYNLHTDNGRNHLVLFVFATEEWRLCLFDDPLMENKNDIYLNGYIVKEPVYRKTPLGRDIAEVLIAVHRNYGKSDYIPCICWGRNALFVSRLQVGDQVKINGRIQSREYDKKINDNEFERRIAYEVSASRVEWVREERIEVDE